MTITEKIKKQIEELQAEENNLREALINGETVEARMSAQAAIDKVREKIAEMLDIIAELDAPAAPAEGASEENKNDERKTTKMSEIRSATQATENTEVNAAEERANKFNAEHKTKATVDEMRSVLISTGEIAKPTSVGGINDTFNTVSSLIDQIKVEDMTGMGGHTEAYVQSWQAAALATDGTASSPSDPTFRKASFTPYLIDVLTYVSRELRKQTPLQYEAKAREGALIALRKKVNNLIVQANGSNTIYGIYNAVNTESTPEEIYDTLDKVGDIDEKFLRNVVFAYGGDENIGGAARLFINKNDLIAFGDVRGSDKKAVYEIIPDGSNPNTGVIKDGGLSVPYTICSDVTGYAAATGTSTGVKTMIYGTPASYKLGLHGDFEIRESEDYKFAEGLIAIRGEVMVSGNMIADGGMLIVVKKDA